MPLLSIIRHGETEWNRQRRIQGQGDSALTAVGLRQAEAVARRIRQVAPSRLVSSDLGRTIQTAQPIAEVTTLTLETDSGLRERSFGIFEGLTPAEIEGRYPAEHALWQARDPSFAIPGGESLLVLRQRVAATLERIAGQSTGDVVIVTHGGVLDAIYRIALGLSMHAPRTWQLLNASVNQVEISFTAGAAVWHLHDWADTRHLAEAEDEVG